MQRKPLLIGNWKLNHSRASAAAFFSALETFSTSADLAIAPVAPMLELVGRCVADFPIKLAAQNVFYEQKGAYTGEWSAEQLKELGVSFCIVGHSERRALFFETDELVQQKVQACFRAGVIPVICVGETLAEREADLTFEVIKRQVTAVLASFPAQNEAVFAYEPVWAIGTGKTATREQAQEVHAAIRSLIYEKIGEWCAENTRILYGGSVNAQNIREIIQMPDVDGALVGGASLQAESFLSMVKQLHGA